MKRRTTTYAIDYLLAGLAVTITYSTEHGIVAEVDGVRGAGQSCIDDALDALEDALYRRPRR